MWKALFDTIPGANKVILSECFIFLSVFAYTVSNVVMVDENLTLFHHYLRYFQKSCICVFVSVIFISFFTFCAGLQEEELQTAHLMSFTWASHIAASVLTGR